MELPNNSNNNNIEIKELKDVNIDEFVILWNNSHLNHFHDWQKTKNEILDRNKLYGISDTESKVALINGKQVAFILIAIGIINGKRIIWNGATAVLPEYRNKGIAFYLYNSILNHSKKQGYIKQAVLELITINENAFKLYTKLGFKIKYNLILLECKLNKINNLKHKLLIGNNTYNNIKFIPQINITEYHLNNQCNSTQFQSLLIHNHTLLNIEINDGILIGYILYRLTNDKSTIIFHQLFIDNNKTLITNEIFSSILNYFYQKYNEIILTLNLWNISNLNTQFVISFNNNEFKQSFKYYTMKLKF